MDIREVSKVTETEGLSVLGVQGDNLVQADAEKVIEQSSVVSGINQDAMDLKMLGYTIPKECPIQNEVNGNTFIQKVGRVDLGRLNGWQDNGDGHVFYRNTLDNTKVNTKGYSSRFDIVEYVDSNKECIVIHHYNGYMYIMVSESTDVEQLPTLLKNVYLYYELDEPITHTIDGNEVVEKINDSMSDYGLGNKFDGVYFEGIYDTYCSNNQPRSAGGWICNKNRIKASKTVKVVCDRVVPIIGIAATNDNGDIIRYSDLNDTRELSIQIPSGANGFFVNVKSLNAKFRVYADNEIDKINNSIIPKNSNGIDCNNLIPSEDGMRIDFVAGSQTANCPTSEAYWICVQTIKFGSFISQTASYCGASKSYYRSLAGSDWTEWKLLTQQ